MPNINIRLRGRNDTEANWQQANPILLKGEPAYSTDKNNRYKIGDGTSHWDELEYAGYKIGENITETNNTLSITSENVENALGFNPATRDAATIMAPGLMSQIDKVKLNTIEEGANNYVHPNYLERTAGFYKVTVDDEGHVINASTVVKSDITALGIPAQDTTYDAATTSKDGLMSSEDKTKLDGIASGANKYTHPSFTARNAGLYKVTVNNQGHVTNAVAVTKEDITALGIPAQDTNTTYTVATTSKDGLMSSEDKTKLDGIASGANKTVVDSSLSSSSTNPVQNKVINSALAGKVSTSRTVNGKALSSNIVLTASDVNAIPSSQKGSAGGVASLDSSGFILSSQLPPSVDEILEGYLYNNAFYEDEEHNVEIDAQSSKIYVDLNNNLTYRWSGTAYVEISKSLAIGETSSTAYRGDRGKIAYDHSQAAHARTDATNVADSSTNGNILVNGSQVNVYTHPSYTQKSSGLYKITVDGSGHVSGATAVTKSDITDLGIPAQDTNTWIALKGATSSAAGTAGYAPAPSAGASNRYLRSDGTWAVPPDTNTTYSVATTSKDGLMSSEDKTKLDGIASGANKYTHPSYTAKSSGLYKVTVDAQGHVSATSPVTKSDITALGIPGQDTNTTYTLGSFGISATAAEINKLDGLTATTAELNYVDGVTSNIQTQLNGKSPTTHSHSAATTKANGFMSSSDKTKLDGIASGANKYTHPSYTTRSSGLYKITVDSQGHVSSVSNVTKSDITNLGIPGQDTNTWTAFKGATASTAGAAGYVPAPSAGSATRYFRSDGTWAVPPNTTYSVASTSANGLMSASDKTKLDGIATGANKYTHPSYTAKSSGLYKVTVDSTGHVSATSAVTKADITALGIPGQDTNTTYTLGSFGITATATEINKLDGLTATTAELNYVDGVTSNIQTQLNGKLSTSGTAAAATKLATGRSIGLSTAVSATTQTFDGTGNITIPVNGVKEAYLEWGGRSMSGGFGPLDASLIPELGANRLAFMPASAIEIQYSTNGGSTWATYPSVTDTAKINLFNGNSSNFYIGANSSSGVTKDNYQLRIIFTSNIAKVYTALQKFAIYLSTQGSNGSWCTIDAITKANVDAGKDTWTTFANKVPVAGWSGWNIINVSSLTTYSNNSSQYQKVRFTFGVTSHSSSSQYPGLVVNKILGFGGMGWQIPSTMAGTGRMYTYDASQNVTFPANVKATKFQGATASTSEAGLMSAADKTKLDGIATGANKYTHPSYTAKSSGLYKITVDSSGHVSATTAVSKSDITALGIPGQDTNTTYSAATTSKAGLMSASDKTKLNGIHAGANNIEYSTTQPTGQAVGDYWVKLE